MSTDPRGTWRKVWDEVLDYLYDVRSMTLALRYHGVPVVLLAAMIASYGVSIESWASVVRENQATLTVSIEGFGWIKGVTRDAFTSVRQATGSYRNVYAWQYDQNRDSSSKQRARA